MELRKGFYFSLDAMLAAGIIFMAFFAVMQLDLSQRTPQFARDYQEANTVAEDAMQIMTGAPLRQAFSAQERKELINTTVLEDDDLNRSVMNVIAILWASNQTESAKNLTRAYLNGTIPSGLDYRLKITNEDNFTVYSSDNDFSNASLVARSTRLVTGVSRDRPSSGFLAKASLTSLGAVQPRYFFFGGYVGDGNITANMSLPDFRNVVEASIEADVSGTFDLYINGEYAGNYTPSAVNLSADRWTVCNTTMHPDRCGSFQTGNNNIRFVFRGNGSSIGGGFLRVAVNDTQSIQAQSSLYQVKRDRLPGVNGVINIFSSFTVPGTLHGMRVYLHYNASTPFFLRIGNATVYRNATDGEHRITLGNTSMFANLTGAGLTYTRLSNTTVPFRLGVRNISMIQGQGGDIDAVATTDISGSMDRNQKIERAKNATKMFIDIILNTTDSRVGLTAFEGQIDSYTQLSDERDALKAAVENWKTGGQTCIGCGIIRSVNTLINRQHRGTVLSQGSRWRYRAGTADTGWMNPGFDDGNWSAGTAPLGRGGAAHTQIGDGPYFFRTQFTFDKDSFYTAYLAARLTGNASIYLNGHRIRTTGSHTGTYWDVFQGSWAERSGMWHRSPHRAVAGNSSWYFGQEEVYHYVTDERENGSLVTPPLNLSAVADPVLRFDQWRQIEDHSQHDIAYVEVNDGTGWQTLAEYTSSSSGWTDTAIDLSPYRSNATRIRFRFDTYDNRFNDHEGWYVDNVSVAGFRSAALNRSRLDDGTNLLAVRLDPQRQPFANGSRRIDTRLDQGSFRNTTMQAGDVVLENTTHGSYRSPVIGPGRYVDWTAVDRNATVPAGTNLSVAYGTNNSGSWNYHESFDAVPNTRFLRYRITMESNSTNRTPELHALAVNYSSYGTAFDLRLTADTARHRSIVVLSDGKSNQETAMTGVEDHNDDGSVGAQDHSIEAACRADSEYNITVYTVAFGGKADEAELKAIAECGDGKFYEAGLDNLTAVYERISRQIIEASFEGQRIEVKEGSVNQTLYPDSYLRMNYSSPSRLQFGKFRITQNSGRFGGNVSSPKYGSFMIPNQTEILNARLLSYSSNYWTDRVTVENQSGLHEYVFRLWKYGEEYRNLGDPYQLHIPPSILQTGQINNVSVNTALNRTDPVGGSPDSRVIYELQVSGLVGYGNVFNKSDGGTTNVSTDYGNFTLEVGLENDTWDPRQDALDNATERLLNKLDVDDDGTVDFQLDADNLDIDENSLSGLKWLWGPARVTLEVWEDE